MRLHHALWVVCALATSACASGTQPVALPPPYDPNDYPNPYHVDAGWAKLGRPFGGVSALDMDPDGKSVWVLERCGGADDGCAKTETLDPVLKFDSTGKLVKHWGAGNFLYPHGIFVTRDRHIWLVEGISISGVVADVIHEYTEDGKLLCTMGMSGTTGDTLDRFNGVFDVLVAPDGGIFVADGDSNETNNRILKYDPAGKFPLSWGKLGSGSGEFNAVHGLAMDREGHLYVADRSNNRIQIFDQQGKFLGEWKQLGRQSGLFITRDDMIYVADSPSSAQNNPGLKNGIRWGHISDGQVIGFIAWGECKAIEAVAVDRDGNIYIGFTNVANFRRWSRSGSP